MIALYLWSSSKIKTFYPQVPGMWHLLKHNPSNQVKALHCETSCVREQFVPHNNVSIKLSVKL